DPTHSWSEDCAYRGKGRFGVARVVHGSPRRARAPDHRRVERGKAADDDRPLSDERVGDGDDAAWIQKLERIGQRARRGAVSAAGVAEEDEHARRTADWSRVEEKAFGYLRR